MFLKFQGFFYSLFQHSATSISFKTLCTIQAIMSNLCQYLSVLLALIKKYVDINQIYICYFVENFDFHEILWRLL